MKSTFAVFVALTLVAPAAGAQESASDTRPRGVDTAVWRLAARRDTLVLDAPALAAASTLSELLAARVPGLQVRPGSGAVGAGSRLRLRGASGILTPNDPLVVVNGVRVGSSPADLLAEGATGGQSPSRFDDFAPEEIERVEVLSGPAGIALYGPEGANGVVEISTRRATRGGPRVRAFAEAGARSDVARYPTSFGRVGRTSSGARTTRCTLLSQSRGICTPVGDSLGARNGVEAVSPFRTGAMRRVGASVDGGLGPLGLLAGISAERDLGVLRRDSRERTEARGSFGLEPGFGVQLSGSVTHLRGELELPAGDESFGGSILNATITSPLEDLNADNFLGATQAELDTLGVTQAVRRTTATASLRWSPLSWLTIGGQYGIDAAATDETPHDFFFNDIPAGYRRTVEGSQIRRNADAFARAEYSPLARFSFSTTAGAERWTSRRHTFEETVFGTGGGSKEVWTRERVTAVYGRQGIAWRDRVFAGVSVRRDELLSLPDPLLSVAASAAWEVGDERFFPRARWMDGLRLRAAYARTEQGTTSATIADFTQCVFEQCDPLDLQRHAEAEGGVDVALLSGRVELSLTGYQRRTDDVFARIPRFNGASLLVGDGRVTNRGAEARIRVGAAPGVPVRWELVGTGAVNRNRLEDREGILFVEGTRGQVFVEGRPLGAYFGSRITGFGDANGDGLIGGAGCVRDDLAGCEVQLSRALEYLGSPDPTRMLALRARTGLRGVGLSALLDHQGGVHRANHTQRLRCSFAATPCQAAYDPSTSLAEQAEVVAIHRGYIPVEDASFTRLREAAVSLALPERWARRFGGRGAELIVAGRNLALWTAYSGPDPEVNYRGQSPFATGEGFTQPLPRTFTTRVDVSF